LPAAPDEISQLDIPGNISPADRRPRTEPRREERGNFRLVDFARRLRGALVSWLRLRCCSIFRNSVNREKTISVWSGLLVSGLGMLSSGRLNAEGFIFASLLDRPLVPLATAILCYLDITPWPLALVYSIGFRQLSLDAICLAW
jgi:hypothetical protein